MWVGANRTAQGAMLLALVTAAGCRTTSVHVRASDLPRHATASAEPVEVESLAGKRVRLDRDFAVAVTRHDDDPERVRDAWVWGPVRSWEAANGDVVVQRAEGGPALTLTERTEVVLVDQEANPDLAQGALVGMLVGGAAGAAALTLGSDCRASGSCGVRGGVGLALGIPVGALLGLGAVGVTSRSTEVR